MKSAQRTAAATAAALLSILIAGCLPDSITISLTDTKGPVKQATVLGPDTLNSSVAQIDLVGTIGPGGLSLGESINTDDIALMLRTAAKDPSIRAVILRINSPGGGVAASETLFNLFNDFRESSGKPVVVSMADVAASGGYYVAMAADAIVAQPSSVTGSVGVIIFNVNAAAGLNSIGIQSRAITSGPNKNLASPIEPVNPEHEAILQSLVDDYYDQFRERVLHARPNIKSPDTTLDGRVFTGRQALDAGLVDHLGGIPEAFRIAKTLAGTSNAKLVKLYRASEPPATPYASVTTTTHPAAQTQHPLLPAIHRNPAPGIYYLWLPPASIASP